MRRPLFILFFLASKLSIFAQPRGIDDSIMSIKTQWKKGENFVNAYDPALQSKQFNLVYKKVDSIASYFKQAYPNPTGGIATWHASISGKPVIEGGPSPYSFTAWLNYYYYNRNSKKVMPIGETGIWGYVFANGFGWLMNYSGVDVNMNEASNKVWELSPETGEWKGYSVFEPFSFTPNVKVVVVTRSGMMPWKSVSQQQYLLGLRNKLEAEKTKMINGYVDGINKNRKMIDDIRNKKDIAPDTKTKMIAIAQEQADKQISSRETFERNTSNFFAERFKVIDDYLSSHRGEELSQPAIINTYKDFIIQKKFEDPATKGARKLIAIDLAYFDKALPSYAPQFFTFMWRWEVNSPGLYYKNQVENNFPIEKLKAMIATGKSLRPLPLKDRITNEVNTILNSAVGQPNNFDTWKSVESRIRNLLELKWKEGQLRGIIADEAFYINIGTSSMTAAEIQQGKLVVMIGLAMKKPAEFEVLRFERLL